MAASSNNDSQGLKIAVAAFVSLTVILAVTAYFLYSAYAKADAQLAAETQKANTSQQAANLALTQYDELRKRIGPRGEDFEQAKTEMKTEQKKVDDEDQHAHGPGQRGHRQGPGGGGDHPELEEAKDQGPADLQQPT